MTKTLVRAAHSADFPTLLKIDKASFPPGIAYDLAELSYFMKRKGARTLVAETGSEIAGFILIEMPPNRQSATMITLDILEKYRRQGVATALVNESVRILREHAIARFELQVDIQNTGALEFYKKHGFEIIRRLPAYYSNGNDAYFMVRDLAS